MVTKKSPKWRKNTQYVRGKRRDGNPAVVVRRSFVVAFLLCIVVFLAFLAVQSFRWGSSKLFAENPTFRVRHVDVAVDGDKFNESDIRQICGVSEGMNLFALDFRDMKKRCSEDPDIESVQFKRVLPDTLKVLVRERRPIAWVHAAPDFFCLIDRNGFLMERRESLRGIPRIEGLPENLQVGTQLSDPEVVAALKVIELCENDSYLYTYVKIRKVDVSNVGDSNKEYITLYLRGGCEARLLPSMLESRLFKLAALIQMGRPERKFDLTLDSGNIIPAE